MGKLKSVKKKSANEKWVEESMRWEKRRTDTLERIDRILAKEKETRR